MDKKNQNQKVRDSIQLDNNKSVFNKIIGIQVLITNTPYNGLKTDSIAVKDLESLLSKAINENIPVSHFLDITCYDISIIENALIPLLQEMSKNGWLGQVSSEYLTRVIRDNFNSLIDNVLANNTENIEDAFKNTGIPLETYSLIGGFLIQPSLRFISASSPKNLLDAWEDTPCPICGRIPSIVLKPRDDAWMFKCSFCGAEYKMDIFICPHCKAQGSQNKEFHIVGENKEYEIAACNECNRYYKIINTARLQDTIPDGLEDSYTSLLDEMAVTKNLTRLDE